MTEPPSDERPVRALESALLFVVALVGRAPFPRASFFGTDQAGTLLNGHAVLAGDLFVPGPGIGWSGFSLGPLFNYVAAFALAFRDDFADVVLLLATLHALSVVAYHRVFSRLTDARVARVGAFVLAVHPISVAMGASPISASIILPTTAVFVSGALDWGMRGSPRGFAVAAVGAALMVQAHATTLLLLPLLGLGLRRRAPIGRVGAYGALAGAVLVAPMAVHSLRVLLTSPGSIRHAGGEGGPYVLGLLRALTVEATAARLNASLPPALTTALVVVGVVFAGAVLVGAGRLLRSTDPAVRSFVLVCLVVPTLLVPALPRGALYYYLDASLPMRCLAVGAFVAMVHDRTSAGPAHVRVFARVAGVLCALALALGPYATLHGRGLALADGLVRVRVEHVDLRSPDAAAGPVMGMPTLDAQQRLGRALGVLGADRSALLGGLRGPWRWTLADAAWAFAPAHRGASRPPEVHDPVPGAPSLLVLHETDTLPAPLGRSASAGAFRVYGFDDLCRPDAATGPDAHEASRASAGEALGCALSPSASPVAIGMTSMPGAELEAVRLAGAPVPFVTDRGASGFAVWHADAAPSNAPRRVEVTPKGQLAENPLVGSQVEIFAYATSRTSP